MFDGLVVPRDQTLYVVNRPIIHAGLGVRYNDALVMVMTSTTSATYPRLGIPSPFLRVTCKNSLSR